MNIELTNWKPFKIGELFRIESTKGINSTELVNGFDIPYIGAKKKENGLMQMCAIDSFEDWVSPGNCILFIQLGQGSAGFANYIPLDFIGMNGKTSCGYIDDIMNPKIGTFLATILSKERFRYSFGRSWTGDRLRNTEIKLPVELDDSNSPTIDETKRFSSQGFIPDWKYMEKFIGNLNYQPLTTKNKAPQKIDMHNINLKKHKLSKIFEVKKGKRLTSSDQIDGETPYIGAIDSNNGVTNYIQQDSIHSGNTISLSYNGSVGEAFYQPHDFWATDDVNVLYFKESNNYDFNQYVALFLCTILEQEKYRYSYGRKWVLDTMNNTELLLPTLENGEPDWEFMEKFIKYLPYGDRI